MRRSTLNPGVPLSTRNAEMPPRARFSVSVTAIRMVKSASAAREIQIFRPLITQSSPARTARVVMPVEPGVLLRPDPQALALRLAQHDAGFQRHQLVLHEPRDQVLEHAVLFGDLEVHGVPSRWGPSLVASLNRAARTDTRPWRHRPYV